MKKCTICKDDKTFSEFNKNKKRKDGYNNICRVCSNKHSKKYYEHHSKRIIKQIEGKKKERIFDNRTRIFEFFKVNPCIDCGESDPIVLDFDHVKGKKKYNVGYLISRGYSWISISNEMKKCVVRCSNCHRRKTAKEFGYYNGLVEFN